MKYYGDNNIIRVSACAGFSDGEINEMRFMQEQGILHEYVASKECRRVQSMDLDNLVDYQQYEYNGEQYIFGKKRKLGSCLQYWKIQPSLYNDKTFEWKKNKKYNRLECIIEDGLFEYYCITKEDSVVSVDVRYTACDNRHRNKVTIANIEVTNASNDAISKAIKQWKKGFKEVIMAA